MNEHELVLKNLYSSEVVKQVGEDFYSQHMNDFNNEFELLYTSNKSLIGGDVTVDNLSKQIKQVESNISKSKEGITDNDNNYIKTKAKSDKKFQKKKNDLQNELDKKSAMLATLQSTLTKDDAELKNLNKTVTDKATKEVTSMISKILKCMSKISDDTCKNANICTWSGDNKVSRTYQDKNKNYICYPDSNNLDWGYTYDGPYGTFLKSHIDAIKSISVEKVDFTTKIIQLIELIKQKDSSLYKKIKNNIFIELYVKIEKINDSIAKTTLEKEKITKEINDQINNNKEYNLKLKQEKKDKDDKLNQEIVQNTNLLQQLTARLKQYSAQVAQAAKEKAEQLAKTAKEKAAQVAQAAKEKAAQVAQAAKEKATQLAQATKEKAEQLAKTAKEKAAQAATAVASSNTYQAAAATALNAAQKVKETAQQAYNAAKDTLNYYTSLNVVLWSGLKVGYVNGNDTFIMYNLQKGKDGFNIYEYIKCLAKENGVILYVCEFSSSDDNYIRFAGMYNDHDFDLYVYINITFEQNQLRIKFNFDPRSEVTLGKSVGLFKETIITLVETAIFLFTRNLVPNKFNQQIKSLFDNFDINKRTISLQKGDMSFKITNVVQTIKNVLNKDVYLKSSPPKGSKIEIEYSKMKPLETSVAECGALTITDWQYDKKHNTEKQLWDRFDHKTQCRQKGCQWPRGHNHCVPYEKFSTDYCELVIGGETFKNINYYGGLLQKHPTIEIKIKTATSNEKDVLDLGKSNQSYKDNMWLKITTNPPVPLYMTLFNSVLGIKKVASIATSGILGKAKSIFVTPSADTGCDKVLYQKAQKGGYVMKLKIDYSN